MAAWPSTCSPKKKRFDLSSGLSDISRRCAGCLRIRYGLRSLGKKSESAATMQSLSLAWVPWTWLPPLFARNWVQKKSSGSTFLPSAASPHSVSTFAIRFLPPILTTLPEFEILTGGHGVERAVECSGNADARATAIRATGKWGRIVMVGEGGTVGFNPSPDLIHDQKTIYGSWVTSTWLMEELVERLVRWGLHPEDIVTHRFPLERADEAYRLMASGRCGKVAVCPTAE